MKRILLFSVIIFSLFTWKANAQLVENFDTGIPTTWATFKLLNGVPSPSAGFVPSWAANNQTAYDCLNPDLGTPPAKAVVLGQNILNGNTTQSWLVTEQITVPANGQLEFVSRTTAGILPAYNGTRYMVKVSTTSQIDVTSFGANLIDYNQSQISGGGTYNACTEHILNLAAYVGQNVYIAFVKEDTQTGAAVSNNGWVLDDVKVLEKCLVPTNPIATPQAITADITWTGNADNYEVSLIPGAGTPETGTIYPTNTNSLPLTGLTSSTSYMYYIRAICEFNSSEWAGPFTFYTTQIPFDIGITGSYTENFESPSFGFSLLNGTQTNKWAVGTATQNGGTKSMYISNDNGGSNAYSTASASVVQSYRDILMPASLGQIYFSFDWKSNGESNQDYLRVWVVPSTYTPTPGTQITAGGGRTQIGANFSGQSVWQNHGQVVNAPAAWQNQTMRVVFEWRNNASGGVQPPAAIDNINIQLITCSAPSAPSIGNLTSSEVTFNWNAPGGTAPASYDYYFTTTSGTPSGATAPTGNVPSNTVTIDSLTPSTTYYFWVRSNCGPDGTSFWVGPISFNTAQIPTSLDYYEDFEGANPGWTLNNGTQTNKWVVGTATSSSPTHSLYISDNNGTSNNYNGNSASVVQAYKDLMIPATAGQIYISFDWKAQGEGTADYLRAWMVPVTYTPTPGTQITAGGGRVQLGTNFNQQNTWQTEDIVLNVPAAWAGQIMRLVFEWRNDTSVANQSPAAVDNVNVSVITCQAPSNPTLSAVTINSATTAWTGTSASYDYYYSTTNTPPVSTTTPSGSTATTQANLTGLDDSTTYYFWVRSDCGVDGVSFWVGPLVINTPQVPAPLPYYENFDGANSGYTFNNGTQSNKWVVGGATFNSPSQSLYISNDNGATNSYGGTTSVTQAYRDIQMPTGPLGQMLVSFDWKNTGESSFDYMRVWIVPVTFTPTPGTQITAGAGRMQIGANYNQQASWQTVNQVLNVPATWAGQPIRLVFEWRNDGSVFNQPPAAVDNVNISLITCQAPTNLAITTVTVDSATFTWNAPAGSTPTSYDYYISTTNVSPSPTDTPTGNTTDTTVTVEGLDHSTQYFFWVRSNCGTDDGTSFWIGPVNFNTPQIPAEMNFNDDFEGQIKWTFNNGTQENKWVVGTATSNSPTHSLYISNNNGTTNSYAGSASVVQAYRDIQMPAVVNEVAFSFDWKGTGEGSFDYMRVWLVPTTFTPVPGTQITAGAGRVQIGANYNQQGTWKNEFFILQAAQYQGQIVRVVFEWRNDGSLFNQPPAAVDNVVFHALTCPSPTDLMASTTQGSSQVELTWTPVGTETQWEIIIQISGTGTPLPGATGIIVNEPSYTFLASDDELYEFYVRPICSEDDIGLWSAPGNFSIFTPPGCASIDVVGVGVEIVDGVIFVCPGESTEVNLNASFFGIAATTSYEVSSIDYAPPFPFVGGEVLSVTIDDRYSPVVDLPFNFCFFGESYSKAKVGSNGVVTFGNAGMPGADFCPWSFNQQLPNTGFPIKNSIFGVYQDTHPTATAGITNYQVLGTYPCRALVVNFYELPQFSCGSNVGLQTSQIVVYEISNIIEVYIGNRTPCTGWNGGNGLVGILNNAGNQAYTPPGRNTGAWTATNEAWRFTPNGEANVDFEWLLEDEFLSDQQDLTISLTPEQIAELEANGSYTLIITAQATYETCSADDEPVTTSKDIEITFVYSHPDNEPVDLTVCSAIPPVIFDLTYNDAVMLEGADNPDLYSVHYYNSQADAESGDTSLAILDPENYQGYDGEIIWVRVSDIANCSTGIVKFFTLHHGQIGDVTVDFEYDSTIYCIGGNNPVFIPSEGFDTGGLFSVTPPTGLTINPATGAINLAATGTLPGNYTITYEIVPNDCTAGGTATFDIEIKDLIAPDLDFSYADACVISEVNPTPIITNLTSGGVFSSTTLSVDPQTGEIDLSAGVTAGVHEITYSLGVNPSTCTGTGIRTVTITLYESMIPVTDFDFGIGAYCYSDEDVIPNKATGFFEGGVFSSTTGLDINPATGVVDVEASTPGNYTITYTVDQDINTCNEGGSSTAQITILGEFVIAIVDECRGNNYWLMANPIDGSFAPSTATYVWTIDGIEVGYNPELDITAYLNGADIPQGGINVTVAVNDGCDSYGNFLVTSTICMIQKGISPNGDSDNNSFDLTGMGVKELKIFNRYGMEVYSKTNYVNEWTGLDNKGNELPDGTYFYVIQKNNGEKLSSWIYINRKY
jgi:gliding motility-associated-like protein